MIFFVDFQDFSFRLLHDCVHGLVTVAFFVHAYNNELRLPILSISLKRLRLNKVKPVYSDHLWAA